MDVATILKFLHVVLAILWLGGGMCLILLGTFIGRAATPAAVMAVVRHVALYAPRVFIPCSVLVVVTGVALVLAAGWAWEAWVVLGLARLDYVVQFAIVFLMVAKPGWSDVGVLVGVAAAALAGVVLVGLRPARAG